MDTHSVIDTHAGSRPRRADDAPAHAGGFAPVAGGNLTTAMGARGYLNSRTRQGRSYRAPAAGGRAAMTSEAAVLDLAAGPALVPVLGRIVNAIGGQADIELDRLGDLEVLAETLSASVHRFTPDGRARFALLPEAGVVVLRVGPLVEGGADGLRAACALPDLGPVVDKLADSVRIDTGLDGEYLSVTVASTRHETPAGRAGSA